MGTERERERVVSQRKVNFCPLAKTYLLFALVKEQMLSVREIIWNPKSISGHYLSACLGETL